MTDLLMKRYKGPEVLRFDGVLGHMWSVTRLNADGTERTYAQVNFGAEAVRVYDELPEAQRGHIYERFATPRTWGYREVRRQYAILDERRP